MSDISNIINTGIETGNCDYLHISTDIIYTCVSKLKAGKSDGDQAFDSDNLLNLFNGIRKLYYMLSLLFNCMSVHGHTANDLFYSNIVSLRRENGSPLLA